MGYDIGVDIGGTKIAVALVEDGRSVLSKTEFPTKEYVKPETAADMIVSSMETLLTASDLSSADIGCIGIGVAGLANAASGVVETSPNLGWIDVPITTMLSERTGIHTLIENDANAAALGEHIAGAAMDASTSLTITLGTGIGGGFVIGDRLYRGYNFAELEVGHMVIKQGGRYCPCGRTGCFERYASATGLNITTRHVMLQHRESSMWTAVSGELGKINTYTAFEAAASGDEAGTIAIERYLNDLATGVTNLINILQPEILCLGGGLAARSDHILPALRGLVSDKVYSRASTRNTAIKKAELGNEAGLIGAANLARVRAL